MTSDANKPIMQSVIMPNVIMLTIVEPYEIYTDGVCSTIQYPLHDITFKYQTRLNILAPRANALAYSARASVTHK